MIPAIRSGSRAVGLQAWLAAFHPDKYHTAANFDCTQEQAAPKGLFGTTASIWSAAPATPTAALPLVPTAPSREGFSEELMHQQTLGLPTFLPSPGVPNKPFAFPPSMVVPSRNTVQAEHVLQAAALAQTAQAVQAAQAYQVQAQLQAQAAQAGLDLAEAMGLEDPLTEEADPSIFSSIQPPQLSGMEDSAWGQWTDGLVQSAVKDPGKYSSHFQNLGFQDLFVAVKSHLLTLGPIPDMVLFHLFRKVHTREQADRAIALLQEDRFVRLSRGANSDYSEVTSSAVFCALNRAGGDEAVVAAAESASTMGLTLSRSSMYHLMKQYSVKGKVEHVEKLFRALETAGKSWNSNCIVIMMLAYFNQGKFEEADRLRRELRLRGIKISERIDARLDKLLAGEEYWRWEDKVYVRPRQLRTPAPRVPPGFEGFNHGCFVPPGLFSSPYLDTAAAQHSCHTAVAMAQALDAEDKSVDTAESGEGSYSAPSNDVATVQEAIKEPKIHLNILRIASFDDLCKAIEENLGKQGPLENVVISFLFRKVESREQAEKAMCLLALEHKARKDAGISEEYNETTCSRIFNALFRVGATDVALASAEKASKNGLILSGKALHELLKSFAIVNDVDKVEDIWKLVRIHGKPSSRIVYSIFRTYFDNNMMDKARLFRDEIRGMGINLSASATRNIEEVLSGAKQWVKDPHAPTDVVSDETGEQWNLRAA